MLVHGSSFLAYHLQVMPENQHQQQQQCNNSSSEHTYRGMIAESRPSISTVMSSSGSRSLTESDIAAA
jgi:hypothetical protein